MTDSDDTSPARSKTAQNPVSDSAFVLGALTALAGIALQFLTTNLQPLWFIGAAIVFLAIGSLARSATVVRWERREPEWTPVVHNLEDRVAALTTQTRADISEQTARQQATTEGLESVQEGLSKRFDGMEQWVAKHAVPLVQNPEPIIAPVVRRLTRNTTQDMDAVKEDLKSLKRQCEAAVRAFAALPPGNEMAEWPATIKGLEAGLVMLRDRIDAASGNQPVVAEQLATLRHSINNLTETQSTGKERWRLIERQCASFEEQLAALEIPTQQDIGRRLEGLKATILSSMPDPQAQAQAIRQQLEQTIESRVAQAPPGHLVEAVASLRKDVDRIPERLDQAIAGLRHEMQANLPQPVIDSAITGLKEELQDWFASQHAPTPASHEPKGPAIINAPSHGAPLRAHNPKASGADHQAAISDAKTRFQEEQNESHKPVPKDSKRGRVQATRKLVSRPRRR